MTKSNWDNLKKEQRWKTYRFYNKAIVIKTVQYWYKDREGPEEKVSKQSQTYKDLRLTTKMIMQNSGKR